MCVGLWHWKLFVWKMSIGKTLYLNQIEETHHIERVITPLSLFPLDIEDVFVRKKIRHCPDVGRQSWCSATKSESGYLWIQGISKNLAYTPFTKPQWPVLSNNCDFSNFKDRCLLQGPGPCDRDLQKDIINNIDILIYVIILELLDWQLSIPGYLDS